MIVLGIDTGISRENPLGVAIIDWNLGAPRILHWAVLYDKHNPIAHVVLALDKLPHIDQLDGVGVEAAHFQKSVQTTIRLAEVVGTTISFAVRHDIPLLRCQPAQAKQALTGSDKATKEEMIVAVRREFAIDLPKDAADAVGVAMWAAGQFSRAQRTAS